MSTEPVDEPEVLHADHHPDDEVDSPEEVDDHLENGDGELDDAILDESELDLPPGAPDPGDDPVIDSDPDEVDSEHGGEA